MEEGPSKTYPAPDLEKYKLLAECIRSDQLSASQVQKELEDKAFETWYKTEYII